MEKLKALQHVAPRMDVLLSLRPVIKNSKRAVTELVSEGKDYLPLVFLEASQARLDEGAKQDAEALYAAGCALETVDLEKLIAHMTEIENLIAKLDEIGSAFSGSVSVKSNYSYQDPIIEEWVKEAYKAKFPGVKMTSAPEIVFLNVDAGGNGFIVANVGPEQYKVVITKHEPSEMSEIGKDFFPNLDSLEVEAEGEEVTAVDAELDTEDGENLISEFHYCPDCGGKLHD